MIVDKITKCYQTNSDYPNFNWELDNDKFFIIEDNSEIASKIIEFFPDFDFVVEDDKLIDVVKVENIERQKQLKIQEYKEELEELDKIINRATEDLYIELNIIPYKSTREVIERKEEIRSELEILEKRDE